MAAAPTSGMNVPQSLNFANNKLNNIIGGSQLNPSSNQYLQDYYNAAALPMVQQFRHATDPSILANAAATGNLDSSGPKSAETLATSQLGQSLGNLAANIYEPAYQQAANNQLTAIGMAPGMAQSQYIPANELSGVGGQQQGLQQNVLNWPQQALSGAGGLVGPMSGGAGTSYVMGPSQGGMKG